MTPDLLDTRRSLLSLRRRYPGTSIYHAARDMTVLIDRLPDAEEGYERDQIRLGLSQRRMDLARLLTVTNQ